MAQLAKAKFLPAVIEEDWKSDAWPQTAARMHLAGKPSRSDGEWVEDTSAGLWERR
jgi:hypothetical protein